MGFGVGDNELGPDMKNRSISLTYVATIDFVTVRSAEGNIEVAKNDNQSHPIRDREFG